MGLNLIFVSIIVSVISIVALLLFTVLHFSKKVNSVINFLAIGLLLVVLLSLFLLSTNTKLIKDKANEYYDRGTKKKEIEEYQAAYSDLTKSSNLARELISLQKEKGEDKDKLEAEIEVFLKSQVALGDVREQLQVGDYREAGKEYDEAIRICQGNLSDLCREEDSLKKYLADAYVGRGDLYDNLGKSTIAKEYYSEANQIDPSLKKKVEEKVEKLTEAVEKREKTTIYQLIEALVEDFSSSRRRFASNELIRLYDEENEENQEVREKIIDALSKAAKNNQSNYRITIYVLRTLGKLERDWTGTPETVQPIKCLKKSNKFVERDETYRKRYEEAFKRYTGQLDGINCEPFS